MANFYGKAPGIFGSGGGGGGGGTAPLADRQSLGSGVSTGTITFGVAFVGIPVVVSWITSSNGSADIISVQGKTPTISGFDFQLSTQTPDTTYSLNWIASEVND